MTKSLCVLPFIHFNILANGDATLCCASSTPLKNAVGEDLNVRSHSLNEIWHSEGLKGVRKMMLNGEQPSQCAQCYRNEKRFDGRSFRTQQNALFLIDDIEQAIDKSTTSDCDDNFPKFFVSDFKEEMDKPALFDLRFDNLCNLKCVICFGSASSQIEKDGVHMQWTGETATERKPNRFDNADNWTASDVLLHELTEISTDTRHIQLAGGEPFLSRLAMRWLKNLKDTGRAKEITLMVYTNFIKFDDDIIELLESFKRVQLILSIDAVGAVYEYARYPGKWSTIEKNARRLTSEINGRLSHLNVTLNVTISVVTAFNVCETFDWAKENGFNVNLNNVSYPEYVATKYLPEATKEKIIAQLKEYASTREDLVHLPEQIHQWEIELGEINTRDPLVAAKAKNVMRFLNDMDASRGLDFKKTVPEVHADYIAQFGEWSNEGRFFSAGQNLPSTPSTIFGTVNDQKLYFDGLEYSYSEGVCGSVENASESVDNISITGWAADFEAKAPVYSIVAEILGEIVALERPTLNRDDIEAGFGVGVNPAGFCIEVMKTGNLPTESAQIKLYGLLKNGTFKAVAADPVSLDAPVAAVEFKNEH